MTTAVKPAVSLFAQPKMESNANAIRFLDEKMVSVPASDVPEEFRRMSEF